MQVRSLKLWLLGISELMIAAWEDDQTAITGKQNCSEGLYISNFTK